MKQLRIGQDGKNRLFLFLLWLTVHITLYFYFGTRLDLFDVKGYLTSASILSRTGHLPAPYLLFYSIHIGIIVIFNTVFPNGVLPIIIFQSLVSLLAVFSLYTASKKLFDDTAAGLMTGILFLIWWDCINWNLTLMTESLFCSVGCFLVYSLVKYTGRKIQVAGIMLLLIASIAIRPTGFIFWIASFFFFSQTHKVYFKKNRAIKIGGIIIGIFVSAFMAFKMFSIWDFTEQYAHGNIVTYAEQFHNEEIKTAITIQTSSKDLLLDHRHSIIKIISYLASHPRDFFEAAFYKAWYLLSFTRPYYSWYHNVYNLLWMVVIYLGFLKGISRVKLSPLSVFVLVVATVNVLLIAIATVDWDNRFYIPMEPGIVCISGGGIVLFIKSTIGKVNLLPRLY